MATVPLTIPVQSYLLDALEVIARQDDVTIGQVVRDAIERDLRRRQQAKKDVRTDERLVAPLRSLLADELAFSTSWNDLAQALAKKGFALRESGGGLILTHLTDQERICKASDLGYSHMRLAKRFGAPFPNHSNTRQVAQQIAP